MGELKPKGPKGPSPQPQTPHRRETLFGWRGLRKNWSRKEEQTKGIRKAEKEIRKGRRKALQQGPTRTVLGAWFEVQ